MKNKLILLFLLAGTFLHAQNTSLTVIGNASGVPATMTLTTLRAVFKGETKTWVANGPKIVLALMKSTTPAGALTCSKLYQMGCDEVTKYWLGKAMESNSSAPTFFNSVSELQAFVAGKPGAIGIMDMSPVVPGVHVITIDGKNSF